MPRLLPCLTADWRLQLEQGPVGGGQQAGLHHCNQPSLAGAGTHDRRASHRGIRQGRRRTAQQPWVWVQQLCGGPPCRCSRCAAPPQPCTLCAAAATAATSAASASWQQPVHAPPTCASSLAAAACRLLRHGHGSVGADIAGDTVQRRQPLDGAPAGRLLRRRCHAIAPAHRVSSLGAAAGAPRTTGNRPHCAAQLALPALACRSWIWSARAGAQSSRRRGGCRVSAKHLSECGQSTRRSPGERGGPQQGADVRRRVLPPYSAAPTERGLERGLEQLCALCCAGAAGRRAPRSGPRLRK